MAWLALQTAVWILWEDSAGSDAIWDDQPEKLKPALINSVGILVREDDQAVILATSADDNTPPKYDGLLAIPRSAIRQRRRLE